MIYVVENLGGRKSGSHIPVSVLHYKETPIRGVVVVGVCVCVWDRKRALIKVLLCREEIVSVLWLNFYYCVSLFQRHIFVHILPSGRLSQTTSGPTTAVNLDWSQVQIGFASACESLVSITHLRSLKFPAQGFCGPHGDMNSGHKPV